MKPAKAKTLQQRSKCSSRSNNCFVSIAMKWLAVHVLLSQSSKSTCSLRLWRWVGFAMMLPSKIFIFVLISKNNSFNIAFFGKLSSAGAPIRGVSKWWGSGLLKNGCFTRSEEMETEMGKCFPIHFVLSMSFKLSFCTQIDSKSNISMVLKSVGSLVCSIPKKSGLSNSVSWVWYTFFRWTFFNRSLHVVEGRSKLNVFLKKVS